MSILSLNHSGKAPDTECPIVHPVSKKHWTCKYTPIVEEKLKPMDIFTSNADGMYVFMMLLVNILVKREWLLHMKNSMADIKQEVFADKAEHYLGTHYINIWDDWTPSPRHLPVIVVKSWHHVEETNAEVVDAHLDERSSL